MAERRSSLMEPRMEHLLAREPSKFTLVTLAARRAREINDYYNQLGAGLGKFVPPQVVSTSRKSLSIALEEIEEGKIVRAEPAEVETEAEEAAQAEAEATADSHAHEVAVFDAAGGADDGGLGDAS